MKTVFRMQHAEEQRIVERLFTLIGARWFLFALSAALAVALAVATEGISAVTLRHVGVVLIIGLIVTLLEWMLLHRAAGYQGGVMVLYGFHGVAFVAFVTALLWVGGLETPWAMMLFLLPVIEAGALYGVFGTILIGVLSFFGAWGYVGVLSAGIAVISQQAIEEVLSAMMEEAMVQAIAPHALLFIGATALAVAAAAVRERSEGRLQQERDQARSLLVELDEGIVMYDEDSVVRYINPAAERLLGVNRRDVVGRQIGRFATTAAPGSENLSTVLFVELMDHQSKPVHLTDPDRTVQISEHPLFGSQGEPLGFVRILRDVTHQQRIGKLKSDFVSIAAHQLRTPLSGIKWAMEELKDDPDLAGQRQSTIQQAEDAVGRMILLVNDLLDVARIEEGRFDYTFEYDQLEPLVSSIVAQMQPQAEERGVVLTYEEPAQALPPVRMDLEKMRAVIESLIDNAISYTPNEGSVRVRLEEDDENIVLTVADTGVGIPEDQQDQVFSKFFRGDNVVRMQTEGTGLGLFIARNIVERHDGEIRFESQEGAGTTFYVSLPVAHREEKEET